MSKVISSLEPSYLGLRVHFSEEVCDDDGLRNPDNYNISSCNDDSESLKVIDVSPEKSEYPTYVDLECTDLKDGKIYRLNIIEGAIQNASQTKKFVGDITETYTGVSLAPIIQSLKALSSTEIQVVFSKTMNVNSDLLNPKRYVFDKGLKVIKVISPSPGVVILTTTKQFPSELYTLTVS